ncbi:MAG: two component transcriptional regulator, winged helix family [Acidimicrobiales bacterium]|nr:two component transcriptional regulator, winged helix family [Acidimicrobiales bacterium]
MLRDALLALDLAVIEVRTAAEGLDAVLDAGASVAVLGLGMPDQSMLQALAEYRRSPDLHLIVLAASGGLDLRMRCFAAGADDVVADPFDVSELAARVFAGVRRASSPNRAVVSFEHLELDLRAHEVRLDDRTVPLTRLEFNLFRFMALHPGRTYSRDQLLSAVWGSSASAQHQTTVTEHVRRLRNKLDLVPANRSWISTVRGRGYHFNAQPDLELVPTI